VNYLKSLGRILAALVSNRNVCNIRLGDIIPNVILKKIQLIQLTIVTLVGNINLKQNKLMKDVIVITAKNALGESRTADIINPSCHDILNEIEEATRVLGYGDMQLYIALMEHAEKVANRILKRK
jgi:hypothetical protein